MPRWFAGSKYSDILQRTCTATTLMFLMIQRKQPSTFRKRREAELLLSKGEDVHSCFDDWDLPQVLGPLTDGGDPCLRESDYDRLKMIEEIEARHAVKDVAVE
jgi:hypothetical protein